MDNVSPSRMALPPETFFNDPEPGIRDLKGLVDILRRMGSGEEPVVVRVEKDSALGAFPAEELGTKEVCLIGELHEGNGRRTGD